MEEIIEKCFDKYPDAEFIEIRKDKSVSIMKYGDYYMSFDKTIEDFESIEELRNHLNS